jgi:hypothetical protein
MPYMEWVKEVQSDNGIIICALKCRLDKEVVEYRNMM